MAVALMPMFVNIVTCTRWRSWPTTGCPDSSPGLAAEIFGITELPEMFSAGIARPWYSVQLCAEEAEVRMLGGATMRTPFGLTDLASADTVIIPSVRDVTAPAVAGPRRRTRTAHEQGSRLVSICSGAFALAAAGVLDGRSATTHWIYVDLLQQRYPDVDVDPAPLYVDEGNVLTSAGCAAGLDLCLHIVRSDHGAQIANDVARRLVISPHRAGGQAQYIESPVPEPTTDGRIAAGMDWALANLDQPITLDDMAAQSLHVAAHLPPTVRQAQPERRRSNGSSTKGFRRVWDFWNRRRCRSSRLRRGSASSRR